MGSEDQPPTNWNNKPQIDLPKVGDGQPKEKDGLQRLGATSQAVVSKRPESINPKQAPLHIAIRRVHRHHIFKEGNTPIA
ncbi:hypothetical protein LIER_35291 [Lithospermum erythrorhizon]|uniref:Uncharacterized protein n=1 Tax=Lithospermum erythrorhizon TaxID=34254 RepID=A0AAV3NN96_LITER